MDNFLNFIEEDVEAKKTLISTMPVKTKINIRKYNDKIDDLIKKYDGYEAAVKKYIDTKSKSFRVPEVPDKNDKILELIAKLEQARFALNPYNNYYEKMGFDNLLYKLSHYYIYKFNSLNLFINDIINKFGLAGIILTAEDFYITPSSHEYMLSFFESHEKNEENYEDLKDIFEKIYWNDPEIVKHIELDFFHLIRIHEKNFNKYIEKQQNDIKKNLNIASYNECLECLKSNYAKLQEGQKETVYNIIEKSKSGEIDINMYFADNKIRIENFKSLMIEPVDFSDKLALESFYENIEKLRGNLVEFEGYIRFLPLIDSFKKEYFKNITENDTPKTVKKEIIDIEKKIAKMEKKLLSLSKKNVNKKFGLFESKSETKVRELSVQCNKMAKDLYVLYFDYMKCYFKNILVSNVNSTTSVLQFLHLYYSFDYFKKQAMKKVFKIDNYEELSKNSDDFDLFSMNPNNVILDGVLLFNDTDLCQVITNRFRLNNINLNSETFDPNDLEPLINKIDMLLRVKSIEESETTVEKIWFMTQVNKIDLKSSNSKSN